ncbi:MmcQ/YjbR family DNA-binding protein [Microlunatus ginsengisoli]|uniref:MmcQ/YjbR family DNA-binding protein n=1 Tax=Microlunatus ginsengisoli TaxID=363863 RepID=A0ABP6ZVH1_9ACTN
MATVDDVRAVLSGLPRSTEVVVRDRVKFRVGQIVYVAFSQDETEIGFAFPKEERAELVAARPDVFFLPRPSDLRFQWVEAWLAALEVDELRELLLDAWRMVVPKRVAREALGPLAESERGRSN